VRSFFAADDFSRRSNFDLLNLQDVRIANEYDLVIHLGALLDKNPAREEEVFLTNVEGTVNLLGAMRKDSTFIFASTKDVYGRFADNFQEVPETCQTLYSGQSALEWSKLIAERYVEYFAHTRNFRSCVFRLSTVVAPNSEGNTPNFVSYYADLVNKGEPIAMPDFGKPRRDFLYVDDFSRACKAFMDSTLRHGLYNLGGGAQNACTLRELVKKLEEVSGLQAVIDDTANLPAPVPQDYVSDLSRVKQELGWSPTISLRDSLAAILAR
jgi:nucleoside-diphosphate-sugar epimerase